VLVTPLAAGVTRHERYLPSEELAPFIEHFWCVEWDIPGPEPFRVATLPHPSVHIVVERGASRIGGVMRGRFERLLQGKGRVFGIKFHPGGFAPYFGAGVSLLTDRTVPLSTAFDGAGAHLEGAVLSVDDDSARADAAEAFLRRRLPEPDPNVGVVRGVVDRIRADRSLLKVEDVSCLTGVSTRALQRLFNWYVGASPKWVIQRFRLHEAAERLARGHVDGARVALELGYSDQAHFIRDFKAMVGVAPGAYSRGSEG
jgi:AraC-like DNA-binding protein